jgi:Tfp pilus assembly protein PilO
MMNRIQIVLGIVVILLGGLWWVYDTRALAEDANERSSENKKALRGQQEQVQILTDIHVKQQAAEEAEEALIAQLCQQGKLKEEDCP